MPGPRTVRWQCSDNSSRYPCHRVNEKKHSTEIRARLTFRVNAYTCVLRRRRRRREFNVGGVPVLNNLLATLTHCGLVSPAALDSARLDARPSTHGAATPAKNRHGCWNSPSLLPVM